MNIYAEVLRQNPRNIIRYIPVLFISLFVWDICFSNIISIWILKHIQTGFLLQHIASTVYAGSITDSQMRICFMFFIFSIAVFYSLELIYYFIPKAGLVSFFVMFFPFEALRFHSNDENIYNANLQDLQAKVNSQNGELINEYEIITKTSVSLHNTKDSRYFTESNIFDSLMIFNKHLFVLQLVSLVWLYVFTNKYSAGFPVHSINSSIIVILSSMFLAYFSWKTIAFRFTNTSPFCIITPTFVLLITIAFKFHFMYFLISLSVPYFLIMYITVFSLYSRAYKNFVLSSYYHYLEATKPHAVKSS